MKKKQRLKVELEHLPTLPGAYLMIKADGKVLYVGKANNLQSRVRNHFGKPPSRFAKLVDKVEYIAAENPGEALLLEYNLIKKYHPPYNIRLRDDKRYPYIKLTLNETWPRAFLTRTLTEDGALYFGPYPNVRAARLVLGAVKEIFPYRGCKYKSKEFPLPRPCIDFEMKRCVGPCINAISVEEYQDLCKEVSRFLKGHPEEVKRRMKANMEQSAEAMQYEKAASYRDILNAIDTISERQIISTFTYAGSFKKQNEDYLGLARWGEVTCMVVLKKRGGKVIASEYYFLDGAEFDLSSDPKLLFEAFIPQYYDKVSDYPKRIFLPVQLKTKDALEAFVAGLAAHRVQIHHPLRGTRRKTLEMAEQNATLRAEKQYRKIHGLKGKVDPAIEELQRILELPSPPLRIEAYDISNLSGTDAVGSMVVLQSGLPYRSGYRKFKIKKVEGVDDYAMMREMLERRIERKGDDRFGRWPDLILIDGGKGHLSTIDELMREKELSDPPLISLAKKEEEIFTMNRDESIRLPETSPVRTMLQRLRDEAHRFAITYHRTLRRGKLSHSVLEEIDGLGRQRKQNLIRHFGSVEAISTASESEICRVKGISSEIASRIKKHLSDLFKDEK